MYLILLGLLLNCQRFANKTESSFFCWLTVASLSSKSQLVLFFSFLLFSLIFSSQSSISSSKVGSRVLRIKDWDGKMLK